ncbi:hypothetical protein PGIGA_G00103990 [Pangasianodon gigas]|uniref:Uncharacterized protein n=1 Tax=Pangasianodon gigas TaxID=30993 RepID=A0ACC5W832_PANGG|nr:hypothetical protein [Pangasianodon gigas]
MWQGIQAITDYRATPLVCDGDASLPDALNDFYTRFEAQNNMPAGKTTPTPTDQALCLSAVDIRKTLSRINPRKAAGPDSIPVHVPRECSDQFADVLTDIFNISLSQAVVPVCFKTTTIIAVLKKSSMSCLNDYRPVALTPIIRKCFEQLVMKFIKSSLHTSMDPFQSAYSPNCSTDDAISATIHLSLTHLDKKDNYTSTSISSTTSLNTSSPQSCVLSPLLFTLLTHDCAAKYSSNRIIKFADDTIAVCLIRNTDESAYRIETLVGSNPYEVSKGVSKIIRHPKYNSFTNDNDITLLRLNSAVTFTDYIRPVCLAGQESNFPDGTSCWITGWGNIASGVWLPSPGVLQEAEVPVVDRIQCDSMLGPGLVTENMICAGVLEGGTDTCQGDSGGPMVTKQGAVWIQAGITSWGKGCALPGLPGVYTLVSQYQSWISSTIKQNLPGFVTYTPTP